MDQCRASVLCLERIMKTLAFPRQLCPVHARLLWLRMLSPEMLEVVRHITSPVPGLEKGTKEEVEAIHALENLRELQRLLHLGTEGP